MEKKVNFPLEMSDGVQVRSLEALKDNFNIKRVIAYFLNGKLLQWLEARYYEDEAEQVASLLREDVELGRRLSEIFGIEYAEAEDTDVELMCIMNQRLSKLKQFTDEDEIIKDIDIVAFDQEELAALYDRGVEKIYLCEGEFTIPKSKQGLEYKVIGGATVHGLLNREQEDKKSDVMIKPGFAYDTEFKLSADDRLFALECGVKSIIAEDVNCFAQNSKYIFYCRNYDNRIFRYDPLRKEEKVIVYNSEIPKDLRCSEKYVFWTTRFTQDITMCDLDGDFIETIIHDYCGIRGFKKCSFQIYGDYVFYFNSVNRWNTSLRKMQSKLIAFNIDTKKARCITNHKDAFCIYNNKVYSCMYIEYPSVYLKDEIYIEPGNYFYESNLDGSFEKEIKMLTIEDNVNQIFNIRCNDGKLHYTYNNNGLECEECFNI